MFSTLVVETTGVPLDNWVAVTWHNRSPKNTLRFKLVPTATHRAVAVHLRLALEAFGLSELVALRVQITGFAAYVETDC